jgi:hypothetical protein
MGFLDIRETWSWSVIIFHRCHVFSDKNTLSEHSHDGCIICIAQNCKARALRPRQRLHDAGEDTCLLFNIFFNLKYIKNIFKTLKQIDS